jgi:hypothetical protein
MLSEKIFLIQQLGVKLYNALSCSNISTGLTIYRIEYYDTMTLIITSNWKFYYRKNEIKVLGDVSSGKIDLRRFSDALDFLFKDDYLFIREYLKELYKYRDENGEIRLKSLDDTIWRKY